MSKDLNERKEQIVQTVLGANDNASYIGFDLEKIKALNETCLKFMEEMESKKTLLPKEGLVIYELLNLNTLHEFIKMVNDYTCNSLNTVEELLDITQQELDRLNKE